MGATIRPDVYVQMVSPVPAICTNCKFKQWVAYEEHFRYDYACNSCGEWYSFNPDFYPTEFPLTEMHLTYGSMHKMLNTMNIVTEKEQYFGVYEVSYVKERVHMLEQTVYYKSMVEIINQAEKLGVAIVWA